MITDRNLPDGAALVAAYKGREARAVLAGGRFRLDDGREFASISQAAAAVTGNSVNGWRFWTLDGVPPDDEQPIPEPTVEPDAPAKRRSRRLGAAKDVAVDVPANGYTHKGDGVLRSHALEVAGLCGGCGGPLFASDGHWHERRGREYAGSEPVCCKCKGHAP